MKTFNLFLLVVAALATRDAAGSTCSASVGISRLTTYELEWVQDYATILRVDKVWGDCSVIDRERFYNPLPQETLIVCLKDELARHYEGTTQAVGANVQSVRQALGQMSNHTEQPLATTAMMRAELEKRIMRALVRNPSLQVFVTRLKHRGTTINGIIIGDNANHQALVLASGPCN